jgi:hypothetical protein
MGTEQAVLLRRLSPFAAVLTLLAPAAARAASDSPDPAPGAAVLKPDPAPVAKPKPVQKSAAPAPTRPVVVRATVVAPAYAVPARTQVAAPFVRTSKPVQAKPKPKPKLRTHKAAPALAANFDLPPVVGPAFLDVPESTRTPAVLAAVALLAAALTAGSGAGLVFSWSRR